MKQNIQFALEFHYEFYDDSIHVMDARSFNFCELQLLKAIEELQKYVGDHIGFLASDTIHKMKAMSC